ncbi:TadE/TadG family type IV pilus assembly protein [Sphingomonas sp. CJ99]
MIQPPPPIRPHRAGLTGDARGNALIEFALLLPILAMLLIGMIGYGQYFLMAHTAQQLANDAARASVGGISSEERAELARASVTSGAAAIGAIPQNRLSSSVSETGSRVTVQVTLDTNGMAMVRLPLVPMPDPVIRRRAVAHRGGVL